jgi:hypothetical protein
MTKTEFNAIFEVSGTDGLYDAYISDTKKAAREAVKTAQISLSDKWSRIGYAIFTFCVLVVFTAMGTGICYAVRYNVHQGQLELHDCKTGNTLACQEAVNTASGENNALTDRARLYLSAYREATGHDLPRLYGE